MSRVIPSPANIRVYTFIRDSETPVSVTEIRRGCPELEARQVNNSIVSLSIRGLIIRISVEKPKTGSNRKVGYSHTFRINSEKSIDAYWSMKKSKGRGEHGESDNADSNGKLLEGGGRSFQFKNRTVVRFS